MGFIWGNSEASFKNVSFTPFIKICTRDYVVTTAQLICKNPTYFIFSLTWRVFQNCFSWSRSVADCVCLMCVCCHRQSPGILWLCFQLRSWWSLDSHELANYTIGQLPFTLSANLHDASDNWTLRFGTTPKFWENYLLLVYNVVGTAALGQRTLYHLNLNADNTKITNCQAPSLITRLLSFL